MENYWYMFYHTELIMRVCHVMTLTFNWLITVMMITGMNTYADDADDKQW